MKKVAIGCGVLAILLLAASAGSLWLWSRTEREDSARLLMAMEPAVVPHGAGGEQEPKELELVGGWRLYHDTAYAHAEGEVRNTSGRSLRAVQAVVTWYDAGGKLITTEDAIVEFNPLEPGQVSPWRVSAPWHPGMENARLTFRLFGGRQLTFQP